MKRILAYKEKVGFLAVFLFWQRAKCGPKGLDGSVWSFPARKWNPGLNRDGPDGFLARFRGGRRPTYRGGFNN